MYIRRRFCKLLKLWLVVMTIVPIIWSGAWLSNQSTTKCENKLNKPFLVIGVLFLLISLAYLTLLFCNNPDNPILNICAAALTILFLVLLGYTIFGLVVTTTTRNTLTNQIHYSKWIQNLVLHNNHWRNLRDCFIFQSKLCSPFLEKDFQNDSYQQFQSTHFSSIQVTFWFYSTFTICSRLTPSIP